MTHPASPARDDRAAQLAAQQAALKALAVLDTPSDPELDTLTRLVAELLDCPAAAISLLDERRQWFKARHGVPESELPREGAFCDVAAQGAPHSVLVVEDARRHPGLADSPFVTGPQQVRFYAGAVLTTQEGVNIGSLCAFDQAPRPRPDARTLRLLAALAERVMDRLERRRAEQEAERSGALLRLAQSMAGLGHWWIDVAAGRVVWSDEIYRLHGVTRPAAGERDPAGSLDLYHPDDRAMLRDKVATAIRTGEDFACELRLRLPDGRRRQLFLRATASRGPDGAVAALFGVTQDVTEHTALMEQSRLNEAEDLLRLAEATAGVGHWRLDFRTGEMAWSDEVYRIHGLEPQSAGFDLADGVGFYHPDDQPEVARLVARAQATGEGFDFQLRLRRADGAERRVVSRGVCQLDADGAPAALFGVFQDVTAQAEALDRVTASEARYRLVSDHANDIITRTDLRGRLTDVSPSLRAILGREPEPLIGGSVMPLVHPEDRQPLQAAFARLLQQRRATLERPLQCRGQHADGRWIWLESRPTLVFNARGEPVEYIDVLRDISERKAQEAELSAARERAEAAAEAKADFLANMSHELRTPLNSIIGFTHVLAEDDTVGPEQRRRLGLVEEAGRSLLAIVNDVLDLSKLEAGGVELDLRPFTLATVVEGAAELIRSQVMEKGLRLTVRLPDQAPPPVIGDPDRLRQVLLNLLGNAVKFTERGEVRVELDAARAGSRVRLRLAVSDTGIGIAPEALPRLFQRFSQADGSISRRFGGTGLGLAISERLVKAMGGAITVTSRPGEGSTFVATLELGVSATRKAAHPDQPAEASDAVGGARVLLAEDVAVNRELVRLMLAPLGVRLDSVGDGQAAVAAVTAAQTAGDPYALVLMDMQMPVMDGLEAARRVRRLGGAATRLPIVALSANVLPDQIARCRAAGMNDHVGKPFVSAELLSAVTRWAQRPAPALVEALDRPTLRKLAADVGAGPVRSLLAALDGEIARLLDVPPTDRDVLSARAHSLLGAAGMLGFKEASLACRSLETACRDGGDLADQLEETRAACRRARERIAVELGMAA